MLGASISIALSHIGSFLAERAVQNTLRLTLAASLTTAACLPAAAQWTESDENIMTLAVAQLATAREDVYLAAGEIAERVLLEAEAELHEAEAVARLQVQMAARNINRYIELVESGNNRTVQIFADETTIEIPIFEITRNTETLVFDLPEISISETRIPFVSWERCRTDFRVPKTIVTYRRGYPEIRMWYDYTTVPCLRNRDIIAHVPQIGMTPVIVEVPRFDVSFSQETVVLDLPQFTVRDNQEKLEENYRRMNRLAGALSEELNGIRFRADLEYRSQMYDAINARIDELLVVARLAGDNLEANGDMSFSAIRASENDLDTYMQFFEMAANRLRAELHDEFATIQTSTQVAEQQFVGLDARLALIALPSVTSEGIIDQAVHEMDLHVAAIEAAIEGERAQRRAELASLEQELARIFAAAASQIEQAGGQSVGLQSVYWEARQTAAFDLIDRARRDLEAQLQNQLAQAERARLDALASMGFGEAAIEVWDRDRLPEAHYLAPVFRLQLLSYEHLRMNEASIVFEGRGPMCRASVRSPETIVTSHIPIPEGHDPLPPVVGGSEYLFLVSAQPCPSASTQIHADVPVVVVVTETLVEAPFSVALSPSALDLEQIQAMRDLSNTAVAEHERDVLSETGLAHEIMQAETFYRELASSYPGLPIMEVYQAMIQPAQAHLHSYETGDARTHFLDLIEARFAEMLPNE